jgi:hypothetical protein
MYAGVGTRVLENRDRIDCVPVYEGKERAGLAVAERAYWVGKLRWVSTVERGRHA